MLVLIEHTVGRGCVAGGHNVMADIRMWTENLWIVFQTDETKRSIMLLLDVGTSSCLITCCSDVVFMACFAAPER